MKKTEAQTEKIYRFKPKTAMAIFCAAAFAFMELLITPAYIYLSSDITVSVTVLPNLTELLLKLIEIFTFAVCYSLIIYTAAAEKSKDLISLCAVYASATLLRRLASLGISFLSYGYIDGSDIFNVSVYLAFELLQLTFVAAVSSAISKRYNTARAEKEKAALKLGGSVNGFKIKFDSVFSKDNPLQRSALAAGIMLAAVNVAMRIFYDVSYGLPSDFSEVLIMAAYYLSDILVAFIFYAISWCVLRRVTEKYSKI